MSHARLEEDLPNHPKWGPLSDAAFRLAIRSICWCRKPERQRRHPGFVPAGMLTLLAGKRAPAYVARLAEELVTAGSPLYDKGIWEPVDGGWLIHDFDQYGPPTINASSPVAPNSKAEAGRLGGMRSAEARRQASGTAQPKQSAGATEAAAEANSPASTEAPRSSPEAAPKQTQDQPVRSPAKEQDLSDPDQTPCNPPADSPKHTEAEPKADEAPLDGATRVFEAWKQDTGHHGAVFDRKRRSRVNARIREGFTPERLIRAITNRRNDPFLMGQNDTGKVYDGLETLLRDAAQVERLERLTEPMKPRGAPRGQQPKQPNAGEWKPPVEA